MTLAIRIVRSTINWLAILGCAALLAVLLVNARDEDLTSEARSLTELQRPTVADGQNAYLALMGFDAPPAVDTIAAGTRIVAEHNAAAASDPWSRERSLSFKREGDESRLKFIETADALHDSLDRPALPWALGHARDIRAMTDDNAELVARYLAMQRLPAYANTSVPDLFQPISGGWNGPRRLLLMQSALDAQTGQVARAFEFLAADIAMWRRILGSGGNLIDEMIAVRGLAADFKLLSDLIATPAFDAMANKAELRKMLVPLTPAELNVAPMYRKESEIQAALLAGLSGEPAKDESLFAHIFFKPNASRNLSAQFFSELQAVASHSPRDFVRLRDKVHASIRAMSEPGITWIYNPTGRVFVGIATPSYLDYVARVFDLAAYVRLVRAQLELRLAAVPPGDVPAFLASAGPETRNPYTDQPFHWDASDNSLSFEPMDSRWRKWGTRVSY